MTGPIPGALADAENDLRTAQSEADPHRQGQFVRSAADAAAEVSLGADASAEDRDRAQAVLRSAVAMIPGSLLREAQSMLTAARSETDPHKRRELATSVVAKAREAVGRREVTDDERAQARQVIAGGRLIANTVVESAIRERADERSQLARSAADAAAEALVGADASAEDRDRAQAIVQAAVAMIPGSLLREAQSMLTAARSETDPHKRRELATSVVAKAREAVGRPEVTDDERAQARQVIGGGRLIANTVVESAMRQRAHERGQHAHETPGVAP